jgi:hypothetical protein
MPIIQGALAAGSATRASGLTQLSSQERRDAIGCILKIKERVWRSYPRAQGVVVTDNEEVLVGDAIPTRQVPVAVTVEPTGASEELAKPCCCGLIEDETKARIAVMDFFDEPASSRGAYLVSIFVLLCIVTSTITIVLESLPSMDNDESKKDFFIVTRYRF